MAYRRSVRSRSYGRRSAAPRQRETFKSVSYGRYGLTSGTPFPVPLDLMASYQAAGISAREAERCTITSVTGWITYQVPAGVSYDISKDLRIWFGTKVDQASLLGQLDVSTERGAVAPYTEGLLPSSDHGNYMPWQWLVSRPVLGVPSGSGASGEVEAYVHRIPVRIKSMRKLRSIDESLYLWMGVNFQPGSGEDIEVRYDLTTHAMRP